MGQKYLAPGSRFWPAQDDLLHPREVIKLYDDGFAGVYGDDEEVELFKEAVRSTGGNPDGEQICGAHGLAESGAGKLTLSYLPAWDLWPECLPAAPQRRGDCVSHAARNAALVTIAAEIYQAKPDEVTGRIEGKPEVPAPGRVDGVFSTESIYWHRGHSGDGWHCHAAARVAIEKSGIWIRKNYEQFGVDLTKYDARLAGKWGRQSPPQKIIDFGLQHAMRTATKASSTDAMRDLLANYYGVLHCGGQALRNVRDANGVSRRSGGSWAHAMAYIGVDDRDWAKQKYGSPLLLNQNSWGRWNRGPRAVHDSSHLVPEGKREDWIAKGLVDRQSGNVLIPEGSCWVPASDMRGRSNIALSSFNGWPPTKLVFRGSAFG